MIYLGLFLLAFVAATLLPAQSELALAALVAGGAHPVWLLVGVASAGNTAGSCVNWALGRWLLRFQDRRWFPVRPAALARGQGWYARYGRWLLWLSWLPVVGDPLTFAAGAMRERFMVFLLIVGAAKTLRYIVLAVLTLGLVQAA